MLGRVRGKVLAVCHLREFDQLQLSAVFRQFCVRLGSKPPAAIRLRRRLLYCGKQSVVPIVMNRLPLTHSEHSGFCLTDLRSVLGGQLDKEAAT